MGTRGRKPIDLTNQRFGKLVALYLDKEPHARTHWICQCDCGNIKSIDSYYLRNGKTKSCGCLQKEWASQLGKTRKNSETGPQQDLVGRRFGHLEVLSLAGKGNDNRYRYLCRCDCGNQTIVRNQSLLCGNTQSCGFCSHLSYGEEKISQLLKENNIFFERQKSFSSCKYPETGYYAKFDFYVDNRYIIEFDGRQHFSSDSGGWNNEEHLQLTKKHDKYKDQWCKENNISIIRIPYTRLKELSFQDIWISL